MAQNTQLVLNAQRREISGSKVKTLRKQGKLPGVIFSKRTSTTGKNPTNIVGDAKEFGKIYKEAGESTLITLKLPNEEDRPVLVSEVQVDPITLEPIHVSFYRVDLSQKIKAHIPIEITGEENCLPVKNGEGIIITIIDEVEVECLPGDLPSEFQVDVSALQNVEDTLTVAQTIKVDPSKVELLVDPEAIIVKIDFAEQLEEKEEEEKGKSVEDVGVITAEEAEKRQEEKEKEEQGEEKSDS